MADQKFKAGDSVLHKPSGATWVAWGVDTVGGQLLNMGWPNELNPLSDFGFAQHHEEGITSGQRRKRAEKFGRRFDDDREEDRLMDREWAL